jgi:hypothetical protein
VIPDLRYELPLVDQARAVTIEQDRGIKEAGGASRQIRVKSDLASCRDTCGSGLPACARTFDKDCSSRS